MTSSTIAIRARNLSKAYRIYQHPFDALVEAVSRKPRHTQRVALQSVDLELKRGEIVGVLGRNGAGKSTLLKIIAGTLEKTSGELEVNGRITAILELGTGFHPEYTGRENIYMGGLCLGMSRREIDAKLDGIIDFSELREVIDQSFKTYSTGMQARLTFSTAISVEPDILIIDEALSVGDARFQLKCFYRLQELRGKKTTILLVSHNTNTITSFCDRALILENGAVFAEGTAKKISVLYHNLLFGRQENISEDKNNPTGQGVDEVRLPTDFPFNQTKEPNAEPVSLEQAEIAPPNAQKTEYSVRYGTGEAMLSDWGMFDSEGKHISVIESGSGFSFKMTMLCKQDIPDLSFGFAIKDRRGTILWGMTNLSDQQLPYKAAAGEMLTISASSTMWLAAGDYFVTLGSAHLEDGNKIDFIEDAIGFLVVGPGNIFTDSLVNLQSKFDIEGCVDKQAEGT